jgi:hypothetical protein
MKYLKYFEDNFNMDTYPGPNIVSSLAGNLASSTSDGMIGGEFSKNTGPTTSPYPAKYINKVKSIRNKESQRRKKGIKKIQKLNMLNFEDFSAKGDLS